MKDRYFSLAVKANLVLLLILTVGLGSVPYLNYNEIIKTIPFSVQTALKNQSQILYAAIQNFMLPGEVPWAVRFFKDIQDLNPLYQVHLYRRNGVSAFSDNETILEVNRRIKKNHFQIRTQEILPSIPLAPLIAIEGAKYRSIRDIFVQSEREERVRVLIYKPLINLPTFIRGRIPEHEDTYRRIFISSEGRDLFMEMKGGRTYHSYHPGTHIVKEILDPHGKGTDTPLMLTAMIQRPKDPAARGGWIWVVYNPKNKSELVISEEYCIPCHGNTNELHPYEEGDPNNEFRDYVFFPLKQSMDIKEGE